ncbi:pyridoxamine 5'-phosphate oxidase family protein [Streptomyces sp. DSM 44917]|uniref:Pyridoxamine 5'-phosphate oxidase family protein n=1 Tax=Streptomyces boetiae TaxID=3075541 RepID=A0ABU2L3P1_9ACTN|nr:pyridoxamine 5'-phosphate oxidase family protein [Streptomyces sp. DSM 44917]MDT0306185.1 pyridoxamine 5'-phosphate oxidase family protein [Streptomyces sp. DSM 44917]
MALTRDEREEFLAAPHIAALAVDAGPGRGPLVVPIWYAYEPGGRPWVLTGADSRKARLIRAAGRFSLMVERLEPTVRYVSVEGPAELTPADEATHRTMASRYLTGAPLDAYLTMARDFGPQVVIHLTPTHWLSSDMGSPTGPA